MKSLFDIKQHHKFLRSFFHECLIYHSCIFLPSSQSRVHGEVVFNILQDENRTTEGTAILYLNSFPLATEVKVTEEHV